MIAIFVILIVGCSFYQILEWSLYQFSICHNHNIIVFSSYHKSCHSYCSRKNYHSCSRTSSHWTPAGLALCHVVAEVAACLSEEEVDHVEGRVVYQMVDVRAGEASILAGVLLKHSLHVEQQLIFLECH